MRKIIIVALFFCTFSVFAQGLKKADLKGQQITGGMDFSQLQGKSPEEIKKILKNSSSEREPANEQQMQELMQQLKELNVQIKERDAALKNLMKEP